MEDDNKYLIKDLHKTSTIEFKYKDKIYNLNPVITIEYLGFFQDNKEKLSPKELAINCVITNNKKIEEIIEKLTRGELFYILNKFIRSNDISNKKVNSINLIVTLNTIFWMCG